MALFFDTVEINDRIQLDSSYIQPNGTWLRHQTGNGYIDIGPANTSHAHIYTDRGSFYLNKAMYVTGGTVLNPSDIRSEIFYRKDNTAYYVNPSGTSNLSALNVGGYAVLTTNSSLTNINASNITTGTLSNDRLNTNVFVNDGGTYSSGYTGDMNSITGFRVLRSTSGTNRAFSGHHNVLNLPNTSSTSYEAQLAFETGTIADGGFKFRSSSSGTFTDWYTVWHEGNNLYRLASGTDANTAPTTIYTSLNTGASGSNRAANYSTIYTFGGYNNLQLSTDSDYNESGLFFRQKNFNAASPNGAGWQQWAKVWTNLNDGSGSGLDADLLDGNHASAFASASHTHDDRYYTETESDARYLRRYTGSASGVDNTGYTTAFTVEGNNLSSSIRFSAQGTTASVVVANLIDLVVNHSQDIMIKAQSGVYTRLYVKVVSNNNEDFAVELKTNSGNAVTINLEVFAYGDETVTFTNSHSFTGASLEHECLPGYTYSGTGGAEADIKTNGDVNIGGRFLNSYTGTSAHQLQNGTTNGTVLALTSTADNRVLNLQTDHVYSNGNLYIGNNSYQTILRGSVYYFETGDVNFKHGDVVFGEFSNTNGGRLYINGTTVNKSALIQCTNGNLHIDSEDGHSLYLNYYEGATSNVIFGTGNGGAAAQVNSDGSARFPIYYDYNNTVYYVNPASRSELTSTNLSLNDATALTNGAFNVSKTIKGGIHFTNGAGTSSTNGYQASITFQGSSAGESQAGIYVHNNNSAGTYMALATTNNYSNGPQVALRIDNNGKVFADRNFIQSNTDMRAPLFYDSANTGYYLDPGDISSLYKIWLKGSNSNSAPRWDTSFHVVQSQHWYGHTNTQTMYLGESGNITRIRGRVRIGSNADPQTNYDLSVDSNLHMNNTSIHYVNELHFNDNVRFLDMGNDQYLKFKWGDSGAGGIRFYDGDDIHHGYIYGDGGGRFGLLDNDGQWAVKIGVGTEPMQLHCDNNAEFYVYNSYTYSPGSSRAPIFYDSDNTSYYLNPASTSQLNDINASAFIGPLYREDNRVISPSELGSGRMRFGFGSFGNNNTSPWSSHLHMRSYTDSSGGDDLLLVFKKANPSKVRLYSQTYGSTSAYSSYIDLIDTSTDDQVKSGYFQSNDSLRAPIFYDSDNTAYYVDPTGTTQLNVVNANSLDVNGNITANAYVSTDTSQSRAKFRLWEGSTSYSIGMNSGYTYGHLNDYAMAFQMNDDYDRGFWWGDTSHSNAQGAMSLTTEGKLTVATSVSIGEGEAVTSPSTLPLYVSGNSALNGQATIGSNLISSSTGLWLYYNNTTTGSEAMKITQTQYAGVHIRFIGQSGNQTGSIGYFGTSTTYNTSSDYRLKENVVPMTGAIDRVNQLKPSRFTWIGDPDAREVDGFIAHEVSEIVPEAITGVKDELDAEGNPLYQGIDQSKLVPLLTAALKEAIAKIEDLENRLQILENQ